MIPRLNFHHLFYFYTAATHGSISRAARELRVSQPALSAQIKQLEHVLSLKLFERQGRRLELTEAGRRALDYAKAIFDLGREFMDGLQDQPVRGRLRVQIGVADSVPKAAASALLSFLYREEPSVRVSLSEAPLPVMAAALNHHSLDFVLSDVPLQAASEDRVENHLMAQVPVMFYASPELLRRLGSSPDSLQGAPVILPSAQSQIYQAVQAYFAASGVEPRVIAEVQDSELVLRMAMSGEGIAPLNTYTVQQTPLTDPLIRLRLKKNPKIEDPLYLVCKERLKPHPLRERILAKFRLDQSAEKKSSRFVKGPAEKKSGRHPRNVRTH